MENKLDTEKNKKKKKKKALMMNGYDKLYLELIETKKKVENEKKLRKKYCKKYAERKEHIDSLLDQNVHLKKENEDLLFKINKLETENIRLKSQINSQKNNESNASE